MNNNTRFLTVSQWNDYHLWPSTAALRFMIFNRKTNGLDKFKAIKKIGNRVLIDESAFLNWIKSHDIDPSIHPSTDD